MPIGEITRGTTNSNRLRRVDRYLTTVRALHQTHDPLVVDLGYGASAVTVLELQQRLARVRHDVEVLGLEISPERVRSASEQLAAVRAGDTTFAADAPVSFALGGFETPLPTGRLAVIIRAFNVLRQYQESEVSAAWERMTARLQPGGVLIDGTCNEIGRVCSWVAVSPSGPQTFSISLRLTDLERPSIVAERLPKALIHRNVPGEPIHALLTELDRAWQHNVGVGVHGATQRWLASLQALDAAGWPLLGARSRRRLGELTVPWSAVAPG